MSRETPWTRGPWEYRPAKYDDWGVVRAPNEQGQFHGPIICQARDPYAADELTLSRHRETKTDPWEANARLIAAAPEMALALCQYRNDLKYPPQPDSVERRLEMIDALLARIGAA